jgi:hypothetical protein
MGGFRDETARRQENPNGVIGPGRRPRRPGLPFLALSGRLGRETQPAFRGEPNERAADIGAVRSPLFESLAEAQR